MKKLVVSLAISTTVLAASTLWLAREVAAERARIPAASPKVAVTVAGPAQQHSPTPPVPKVEVAAESPAASAGAQAAEQRRSKAPRDYAREFLDDIATPEGRARSLAEGRRNLASAYPPRDMERLGLGGKEYDRFLDLKAEVSFDYGEKMARCAVTPGCDAIPTSSAASAEVEQRLRDALGAEKFDRLRSYEDALVERRAVTHMRGQLPDSAYLSDDVAERLIAALSEERRRYQAQNSTDELAPDGFGTTDGMLYYMAQSTPEESLASAEEFARRMHRQATPILDRRQLAEFDQMQRRLLMGLREQLADEASRKTVP